MRDCELLSRCGFFIKYCQTKDLACKGFMRMYCKGDKQEECKRKIFRKQHGKPPSDDMLPSGQMIKQA